MNAPLRHTDPPGFSIRLGDARSCVECVLVFDGRQNKACPKCSSDLGLAGVRISGSEIRSEKETAPRDAANASEGHEEQAEVPAR